MKLSAWMGYPNDDGELKENLAGPPSTRRSLTLDSVVPLKTFSDGADTCSHSENSVLELTHSGSLIDDYLKGELAVHVYLRARNEVSNSKSRNLCIVFEKMLSDSKIAGLDTHSLFGQIELDGASSKNCACQIEPSVTVNFGPSIENKESLPDVPCHSKRLASCSRIRLYSFEDSPHIIWEILHTPNTLIELFGSLKDGEIPTLLIGRGAPLELQTGGVVDTRIQGRSELIQHLSEFERKRQEPITLDCPEKEFPVPVRVYLGLRTVHALCIEACPYVYEGLTVNLCPINSVPTRLEW